MKIDDKALALAAMRNHFNLFFRRAFAQLLPGVLYEHNWHIDAICHALEQVVAGDVRRLIITLPPRHLKSTIVSAAFPAYLLGRRPGARIIAASYAHDLAVKMSLETRQIMEAAWYHNVFPGTVLSADKNTQDLFQTTHSGFRMATSVTGSLTGFGGDVLILDDPMKADDAHSSVKRKNTIDWYQRTAATRLDNPSKGAIIVVQQRLHEEDLAGYLLENGGWTHLNLPARAEEPETIPVGGGLVHHRAVGEMLQPSRVSPKELDQIEHEIGSLAFAAQYQQRPGPAGGGIIKWDWFKYYTGSRAGEVGDAIIQSWDFACTIEETSDYSVCLTFLYRNGKLALLDIMRKKMEMPDLMKFVPAHAQRWKATKVILECAGMSIALCQAMRRLDPNIYVTCTPKNDKVTRLAGYAHLVEQGLVALPVEAPWLLPFKQELEAFPNGRYKDQADAFSQTLIWLNRALNTPRSRVTPLYSRPWSRADW